MKGQGKCTHSEQLREDSSYILEREPDRAIHYASVLETLNLAPPAEET